MIACWHHASSSPASSAATCMDPAIGPTPNRPSRSAHYWNHPHRPSSAPAILDRLCLPQPLLLLPNVDQYMSKSGVNSFFHIYYIYNFLLHMIGTTIQIPISSFESEEHPLRKKKEKNKQLHPSCLRKSSILSFVSRPQRASLCVLFPCIHA